MLNQSGIIEAKLLSKAQAADMCGVDVADIDNMIALGELDTVSLCCGKIQNVTADSLARLIGAETLETMQKQQSVRNVLANTPTESYHHTYLDNMFEDFTSEDDEKMRSDTSKAGYYGTGSVFWSEARQEWRAQFKTDVGGGVLKRKLLTGFKTESEARKKLILTQSLANGEISLPDYMAVETKLDSQTKTDSNMLFSEHIENYLNAISYKGSSRSLKDKVRILGNVQQKLGHYKLGELTKQILQRYLNDCARTTYKRNGKDCFYSQSYLGKVYDNLNCCIRAALESELLSKNPMQFVSKPETKHFSEDTQKDLTDDEIRMIIRSLSAKPMLKLIVLIMAYTGVRTEEAFALCYSDFNFKDKTLQIKRALSVEYDFDVATKKSSNPRPLIKSLKNEKNGKKNEVARRTIKCDDALLAEVQSFWQSIQSDEKQVEMRLQNGCNQYLFTAPKDGKLKTPDYYPAEYRKELKRHGLEANGFNLYRFRHNYCTRLLRDNHFNVKTVARMMGDSSTDMVIRVYQSVSKDDVLNGSAIFSEGMSKILAGTTEAGAL